KGKFLSVGTSDNTVIIYDVNKGRIVRTLKTHQAPVGAMAWNRHLLASGAKDGTLLYDDVRQKQSTIANLQGHVEEICGLEWNPQGDRLASGANDDQVLIWGLSSSQPKQRLIAHTGAVKALSWAPNRRGLLASGGGNMDRRIRFWDTTTGDCVNEIETGSQISALMWNQKGDEILSSHGFKANSLCVWKYPSLIRVAEIQTTHESRILHSRPSPDGVHVASAGGDQLCLWNVFESTATETPDPTKTHDHRSNDRGHYR
ncbi:hypothetical protein KIPB_009547, partial [Kipferlia bialata]